MRPAAAVAAGLIFVSNVVAGDIAGRIRTPLYPSPNVQKRHRQVERRAALAQSKATTPTNDDLASWNAQAEAACTQQLADRGSVSSNPTGVTACYNLPFMDDKTGVFQAQLRIYNTSAPAGDWAGVTVDDMMVSLAYLGATVQRTGSPSGLTRRQTHISARDLQEDVKIVERQADAAAPQEMNVLTFAGKVNGNVMGPQLNESQIQSLLIPEIEISARSPRTNQELQVILSSDDASFIKGVFAGGAGTPITANSAGSATALANSRAPFKLPGVTLGIFPVGLIVTVTWVVLFVGVVGLGTYRRHQFRQQYIRRRNREIWAKIRAKPTPE